MKRYLWPAAVLAWLALLLCVPGCSSKPLPLAPTGPASLDSVSYMAVGSQGIGNVVMTYATSSGITQATVNLNQPFVSGPVDGFNAFRTVRPSITILGYGCVRVMILINAEVRTEQTGCGSPVTVSATLF